MKERERENETNGRLWDLFCRWLLKGKTTTPPWFPENPEGVKDLSLPELSSLIFMLYNFLEDPSLFLYLPGKGSNPQRECRFPVVSFDLGKMRFEVAVIVIKEEVSRFLPNRVVAEVPAAWVDAFRLMRNGCRRGPRLDEESKKALNHPNVKPVLELLVKTQEWFQKVNPRRVEEVEELGDRRSVEEKVRIELGEGTFCALLGGGFQSDETQQPRIFLLTDFLRLPVPTHTD